MATAFPTGARLSLLAAIAALPHVPAVRDSFEDSGFLVELHGQDGASQLNRSRKDHADSQESVECLALQQEKKCFTKDRATQVWYFGLETDSEGLEQKKARCQSQCGMPGAVCCSLVARMAGRTGPHGALLQYECAVYGSASLVPGDDNNMWSSECMEATLFGEEAAKEHLVDELGFPEEQVQKALEVFKRREPGKKVTAHALAEYIAMNAPKDTDTPDQQDAMAIADEAGMIKVLMEFGYESELAAKAVKHSMKKAKSFDREALDIAIKWLQDNNAPKKTQKKAKRVTLKKLMPYKWRSGEVGQVHPSVNIDDEDHIKGMEVDFYSEEKFQWYVAKLDQVQVRPDSYVVVEYFTEDGGDTPSKASFLWNWRTGGKKRKMRKKGTHCEAVNGVKPITDAAVIDAFWRKRGYIAPGYRVQMTEGRHKVYSGLRRSLRSKAKVVGQSGTAIRFEKVNGKFIWVVEPDGYQDLQEAEPEALDILEAIQPGMKVTIPGPGRYGDADRKEGTTREFKWILDEADTNAGYARWEIHISDMEPDASVKPEYVRILEETAPWDFPSLGPMSSLRPAVDSSSLDSSSSGVYWSINNERSKRARAFVGESETKDLEFSGSYEGPFENVDANGKQIAKEPAIPKDVSNDPPMDMTPSADYMEVLPNVPSTDEANVAVVDVDVEDYDDEIEISIYARSRSAQDLGLMVKQVNGVAFLVTDIRHAGAIGMRNQVMEPWRNLAKRMVYVGDLIIGVSSSGGKVGKTTILTKVVLKIRHKKSQVFPHGHVQSKKDFFEMQARREAPATSKKQEVAATKRHGIVHHSEDSDLDHEKDGRYRSDSTDSQGYQDVRDRSGSTDSRNYISLSDPDLHAYRREGSTQVAIDPHGR